MGPADCRNQRKYQIFLIVFIILSDLADTISDWLFYVDIVTAEKGLVYGKPDQAAMTGLLVFSIIGSVGYIFEITNLVIKLRRAEPFVNVDLVGALIVWCEDLPQLAISISIARCREEAISMFQIGKAVVIVVGIILRFIFCFIKCSTKNDNDNEKKDEKESVLSKISRAITMIGLFSLLVGAITVFVFTKAQINQNGHITVDKPETVIESRFNDQRYFRNVGIFVSLPTFVSPGSNYSRNWVRLAAIDSVLKSPDKDNVFMFKYQNTDQGLRLAVQENDGMETNCYTIGQTNVSSDCLCNATMKPETDIERYIFRFTFISPNSFPRKYIFGDIKYNFKHVSKDNCSNSYEDIDMKQMSVKYFRSEQEDHLILESAGARFYQKEDLTDVQEVWKTGFLQCEPSGNLFPQLDTKLAVPCHAD